MYEENIRERPKIPNPWQKFSWDNLEKIIKNFAEKGYIKGDLLDVGCGCKPYEKLLKQFVIEYIGIDKRKGADFQGNAENLPFEDLRFNTILMIEVLQFVNNPFEAIFEAHRVLRIGGYLIVTVPFIWQNVDIEDLFRFTESGLRYLFIENEFTIIELIKQRGLFGVRYSCPQVDRDMIMRYGIVGRK